MQIITFHVGYSSTVMSSWNRGKSKEIRNHQDRREREEPKESSFAHDLRSFMASLIIIFPQNTFIKRLIPGNILPQQIININPTQLDTIFFCRKNNS